MEKPPEISVDHDGSLATVTLNRPDKLNSLTLSMLGSLPGILNDAVAQGARAILLTGRGRAFCTGAVLGQAGEPGDVDLGDQIDLYYNPIARAFADLPVPVVTAINGPAAGAGAAIALSGDIIVTARSAYLLLAFANVGLVPDCGATWLVARAAGRVRALEMALLAERMPADEALARGLVTRVVDDEALLFEATAIAQRLAAMPTLALGMIREQVRRALDLPFHEALLVERDHQRRAGYSEDYPEGVRAFREKRKPNFTGR